MNPEPASSLLLDHRRFSVREVRRPHRGLDGWVFALHGIYHRRKEVARDLHRQAALVLERIPALEGLTDGALRARAEALRPAFLRPAVPEEALVDGLACTSLAARRVLGITPYPVQIAGALALSRGLLAEMATGEGKTFTVALSAALQGLTRLPCHVVTANDYLASRDAEDLAPFYAFFGLASAPVTGNMAAPDRARAYQADVVYTTPKELLADFLRDRLMLGSPGEFTRRHLRRVAGSLAPSAGAVLRGLHFAVVDEADSVLIDEAVTPLIISRPVQDHRLVQAIRTGLQLAESLRPGVDYQVDFRFRDILIPAETVIRFDAHLARLPEGWRSRARLEELLRTTLVAREHYIKGIHYLVADDKIHLVDESTGRIMAHRTWQQGLHQAVEAKEGLELSPPNATAASMSFQRFFRCFPRLSGLSGTVRESARELWQLYHLPVIPLPTHRPLQRREVPPLVFPTIAEKWQAVARAIQQMRESGRPVLAGTRSVEASCALAEVLASHHIPYLLLNAENDKEEAAIIARAGSAGAVTIATNMAGRGTDIKLGPGVAAAGGLHVIATERNSSGRIDRQLAGRAGRQGDPGSFRFILSLEDDLLVRYVPRPLQNLLPSRLASGGDAGAVLGKAFDFAQFRAESQAVRARKRLLRQDRWLDENLASPAA